MAHLLEASRPHNFDGAENHWRPSLIVGNRPFIQRVAIKGRKSRGMEGGEHGGAAATTKEDNRKSAQRAAAMPGSPAIQRLSDNATHLFMRPHDYYDELKIFSKIVDPNLN